ncbi:MAG: hypothetical protein J6Y19_08620, partial [Kiritimatiellae bacterium]|nr:hypothetical protein [Kiritimatiellia bacterium]
DTESTKRVGKEERRGKASGGSTKEQKDKEEGNAKKGRKRNGREVRRIEAECIQRTIRSLEG